LILGQLFELELSAWEEGVAAAAWLQGGISLVNVFSGTFGTRLKMVLEKLSSLPSAWARELCLEVLLSG
jgi:hypothetical protein